MRFVLSKEQEFVRKMVKAFPDVDFTVLTHGDKCGCSECRRKRMENKLIFYNVFEGRWVELNPPHTNLIPKESPAIEIEGMTDGEYIELLKGLIRKTGINHITISFKK